MRLQRRRVAAEVRLQRLRQIEEDPDRAQGEHDSAHAPERRAGGAEALRDLLPAEGDQQHRHAESDTVGESEDYCLDAHLALRSENRDRRQNRAGARHEHQPEAEPEHEAARWVAAPPPGHERERPFECERKAL